MSFLRRPLVAIALGVFAIFLLARFVGGASAVGLAAGMQAQAAAAIADAGGTENVRALYVSPGGSPSRHPILVGAEGLSEQTRAEIARAVAAVPGTAGIRWADGNMLAESGAAQYQPLHCQEDVQALLRARSIRFEEGSSRLDRASAALIAEVAGALRPCLGAIIQITGHTDNSGAEPGNLALSTERAVAVRAALIQRGIPADGLRARGVGSRVPVEGLPPGDPANRRIEFSVLATQPIVPTPVDTPAPR
ncbi:OmpA family protein [Erythrobacter sp. EC-HK427]|uniref:OmpA family protein n=1 Tax=Erythrobacter sp. EC-HK427 TaxID=2038396 RepID=UPI0012538948|nr:OmpA family protein [Erythrobacter sp. EC-HK427]VVT11511.1 putative outer membrane lipoprotein [Erythrobacter sp. EC-HK427]